ncbi:MAG: FHA domain-containing protein [Clostridia bacterium]|nr:FHA domain-containing protein [Clostridia bacterium]
MAYSFETQGTHTYFVYTVQENDAVDTMSLGMLTNNKIPGLAPTLFTQMDATKFIKYDVSAKISVKQLFTGQVNKKRLLGVFNGIVDAMLSAEEYMLDTNTILLDLDYIFADVTTCKTVLVCLPIIGTDLAGKDLGIFFKDIMFNTQFDQTENCDHVAKIMNYLNSAPIFSLQDFKKVLDAIESVPTPEPQPSVQKVQPPVQPQPEQPPKPAQPVPPPQPKPQPQPQHQPQPIPSQPQSHPAFSIPGQAPNNPPVPPVQTPAKPQGGTEKEISVLDLLMHYSKENVELYKAQKAAKKAAQAVPPVAPPPVKQGKQPTAGFAIPGQNAPANNGFAIPGPGVQQTPPPVAPAVPPVNVPKPQQPPVQPQVKPQTATPTPPPTPPKQTPAPAAYVQPQVPQGQPMNFGETVLMDGAGSSNDTTILGAVAATQVKPHLVRTKNNEKINLDKPVFRIGKEKSFADYVISDNPVISRSHANIVSHDDAYFVIDTNSTNHTYVDGVMIQSNVETPLVHGTKLRLANEEFEFRMY